MVMALSLKQYHIVRSFNILNLKSGGSTGLSNKRINKIDNSVDLKSV